MVVWVCDGRALTHALNVNSTTSDKANSYLIINEDDDFGYGTQIGGGHVGIGIMPNQSYSLYVNGSTEISGNLDVLGNATIDGTLRVESDTAIFGGTSTDNSRFLLIHRVLSLEWRRGSVAMGVNDDGEGNASIAFNILRKYLIGTMVQVKDHVCAINKRCANGIFIETPNNCRSSNGFK